MTDQEAGAAAVVDAPNLSAVLNALRAQGVADATLTLSSGDAFIPGVFFDASEALFGAGGVADIQIQNELGFQAVALGNHEFDLGTRTLSELVTGLDVTNDGEEGEPDTVPRAIATFDGPFLEGTELEGATFQGAAFPYLSANLDFATDPFLAPLVVPGGQAPAAGVVTSSTVIEAGGQSVGVVGATTPTLPEISSPGEVGVLPAEFDATPTPDQLDALAAVINAEVDALLASDETLDKIVLLAHMQRLGIEEALAARLPDVDVIVAGGSNTRLADGTDRLRDGDTAQGRYPIEVENPSGGTSLVVNTDGSYEYVGRLVIDFDADGRIVPGSYDPDVSGAYATDAEGVAALGAAGDVDPEVAAIAEAVEAQIVSAESNVLGAASVFLNGERSGVGAPDDPDGVRTQETNLGNLTADANLAAARDADPAVAVSIKNGGGIRASIGEAVVPPGGSEAERGPNPELTDGDGAIIKPEGGISQNDVQTTLAFNNGLTLLTLSRAGLVEVLEFGVSALPGVAGQFPQIAGIELAFDPDLPSGERITDAAVVDEAGAVVAPLVQDGAIAGDPAEAFRVVTLSFLADGGDGYPFPELATDRVDLFGEEGAESFTGDATFAADGTEQDALAEFLDDLEAPFAEPDTGPEADERIQNLDFREAGVFPDGPSAPTGIVINEVLGSTTGDDSEYVELFGAPGASLDGLSLVVVESDEGAGNGAIDLRVDFGAGDALGANGFFLLADDTAAQTYGVTPDAALDANAIENSAYTVALVETASLSGDAVAGGEVVLDAVGVADPDGGAFAFDAPVVGPDPAGPFLPAGAGRVADGVDTDAASDFELLSFTNDPAVNTPTAGGADGGGGGGGGSIEDDPTLISAIQGAGDVAALEGETVVVEAIVTGDYQEGDEDAFRSLGGFFLQQEEADFDADAATSEGVFVLDPDAIEADVEAGDRVRVLGTVTERFGKTTIEATEVRVEEAGAVADPRTLAVETALPGTEDREALESMIVEVTELLTFLESFDLEQFGEATLASGGPVFQFSQLNDPDVEGNAAFEAEVADRTITIDDGTDGRREDGDPILRPDGAPFAVADGVRMGQSLDDLTAIVDFGFGAYRLRLPEGEPFEPDPETNPRPPAPEDVGSDFKVASFNVLNYFTTLDDGATTDIGLEPRGAETEAELERQSEKLVTAISALDADVVGLVELENDFAGEGVAIAELVARLNEDAGEMRWNWVDPGVEFVGPDAIAVGFIYDQTTVELAGAPAILDDPSFLDPLDDGEGQDETPEGDAFNRAALAQTFRETETGGEFTAAVNHFKSKGSLTGAPQDEDRGDGAGRNDATREAASERLLDWLETDPTGSGDPDRMILGDLNAYAREDPIAVLEAGGFTDLAQAFEGEDVTSFRFSGQIGTLDYALANAALLDQVTGADTWNINSDELVIFDYDEEATFGTPLVRPDDQGLFDGASPARSSDHDPIVVGLDLEGGETPLVISGGPRFDRLRGTEADEVIVSGGGAFDQATGGGGSDTFVLTDTAGARDRFLVLDFDPARDAVAIGEGEVGRVQDFGSILLVNVEREGDGAPDLLILRGASDIEDVSFVDDPLALV